ncbi:MAG: collagen-like protein [Bacilli bacterium]|nr:collagen-like protein [Bacilli bacterium]
MNKYPKKIDCLLKEGKRCQEKIGIVGPTGPTGPQGPATITVGNVVTGLPGSDAAVTNTGTQENAILTFTIPQGPTGPVGAQGAQGLRGPQGMQGEQGTIGPQGIQGPTGPTGPAGPQGAIGPQGIQGPTGPTGPAGVQGTIGPQGIQGPTGPAGPQGVQGEQGTIGPQGIQGPTGPTGPAGPQGVQGEQGTIGPQGIQGPTGPTGPAGPQGVQGEQGTIGPQGIQGPTGPVGPAAEAVFGRKYNNQANAINLQPNVAQTISLGTTGPLSNVTGDTQDILTTTTDGNYEIEYFFSAQAGTAAEVTVEVIQGSTPIDSSTITKNLLANTQTDFVGSTINAIDANTNISLNVKSTQTVTITPASGTNAYLNIMKI